MKKLINDVSTVVPEMLDGLAAFNPGLSLLQGSTIIVRADAEAEIRRALNGDSGIRATLAQVKTIGPWR